MQIVPPFFFFENVHKRSKVRYSGRKNREFRELLHNFNSQLQYLAHEQ